MLVPLFMFLAIASGAAFLSTRTSEEIVKVASVFITGLCLFFSLVFAPLAIKLLLVLAVPLFGKRLPVPYNR